jgi:hypothetical protein
MPQYTVLSVPSSAQLATDITNNAVQGWEPILLTFDSVQNQYVVVLRK